MTALEPKPRRVRNIFIASAVVFLASSRMTNESLSVRPRMKAAAPPRCAALDEVGDLLELHHVVQASVERPQVGLTFSAMSREEAQLLPASPPAG
jgi:hypothetical protein